MLPLALSADCNPRNPSVVMLLWLLTSAGSLSAADLRFVEHPLDPEAEHNAAAAIDVNRDGKLDVVSGRFWYDLASGQRHMVRDVPIIRGRYDDYSNLPVDVNGDGRIDLVSANYRSAKLLWIEQPANPTAEWTVHEIAQPGPMETARLYDINGDGRLDVLPNLARAAAAWWEFRPSPRSDKPAVEWVRHELAKELAGHGIGAGDINSDGRIDVVGPNGWAEAPTDAVNGEWIFRPEFSLHRDATVPILVHDVDGDGDSDLVWSRAHHTGIFWLEQSRNQTGRVWTRHVIDATWSQCHTLELADLDGDGRPEIVAGKRFMGHDGKDCGEWDPLIICAYSFLPETRTFRRQILASNTGTSWDLDPKIVDLDGDGDLDLICPGRSGLFWLENVSGSVAGPLKTAEAGLFRDDLLTEAMPYRDHRQLMVVSDGGNLRAITQPLQWGRRRAHLRASMQIVMGRLPEPSQRVPLDIQVVSEEQADGYLRRKITFAAEPGDRVPAWLLLPPIALTAKPASFPAMLCLHQTTKIGKDEPAGLGGLPNLHYAHELAQRGYICIVPDYPSFGEYSYDFSKMQGIHYDSGSMKAIWNNMRAVDVLETIPTVHPDRMGVIGHSLGGHNALFTAVFDLRLNAVVSSCGFTPFHDYYGGKLAGWTSDRYMPRIRHMFQNEPDKVPFDFYEIVAAIAPRAFFSNSPTNDGNFDVNGVKKAFAEARKVYDLMGLAESDLHLEVPESGHDFPPAVREKAYAWLDQQLK